MSHAASRVAADLFRHEGARILATLVAHLGSRNLQLAEDVVQEALARALQTWPYRGIPDNPGAWLTQTAKHLALDALRRERRWREKEPGIATEHERWLAAPDSAAMHQTGELADDTLRMLFVCAHPQLSVEMQLALALRTVCGLSAGEIAAAFLSSEAAIAKRLVRARQRVAELELPFAVPAGPELAARLDGVLHALYLLFNEGHSASDGERLVRAELCHEAIRLGELIVAHPATAQPRARALLALMCLSAARLPARVDAAGRPLRLHEQDRAHWDAALLRRGLDHLTLSALGESVSAYHLEAGIAACHAIATDAAKTDWPRILGLYDQLLEMKPSPVVAMNRAVAVARVQGAAAGLRALADASRHPGLEATALFHQVRGALCAEAGDTAAALLCLRRAEGLARLPVERAFIADRLAELLAGPAEPTRSN
jgi:RNA polymerase sigma factor (sigma-70 family)